jgi:hypothetical protein
MTKMLIEANNQELTSCIDSFKPAFGLLPVQQDQGENIESCSLDK